MERSKRGFEGEYLVFPEGSNVQVSVYIYILSLSLSLSVKLLDHPSFTSHRGKLGYDVRMVHAPSVLRLTG